MTAHIFNPAEMSDIGVTLQDDNDWGGHDRIDTVGASEIGSCARQVYWRKSGLAPDQDFEQGYGALERGNCVEDWYVDTLRRFIDENKPPYDMIWTGKHQKTIVRGSQSATPDGLIVPHIGESLSLFDEATENTFETSAPVYQEIKSMDPRSFEHLVQPQHGHRLQCIQGMDLVRSLSPYNPDYAVITYVNASFYDDKKVFVIPFDQATADHLRVRASSIMYDFKPDKPPVPEERLRGGKYCQYCEFLERCWDQTADKIRTREQPLSDTGDAAAKDLVNTIVEARDLIDKYTTVKKEAEFNLSELLSDEKTFRAKGSFGTVSVFKPKPRKVYDTKAMERDGIDISKYESDSQSRPRISIVAGKKSKTRPKKEVTVGAD